MLRFRGGLTMATAFGAEGCILLHMISELRDELGFAPDIFNLDTQYQFPQTLALRRQITKKFGLTIRAVLPNEGIVAAEAAAKVDGTGPLYKADPNACCHWRKVVPLAEAVQGYSAWITAIRRDQTRERAATAIVGPDPKYNLAKINPLANWTKEQVWDYVARHEVPTNPLHAQGFPSIGCWPCTRPVEQGDDERSGRWQGTDKRECGIHVPVGSGPARDATFDRL